MELNLHANAATTPKTRAYIQRSKRPVSDLARGEMNASRERQMINASSSIMPIPITSTASAIGS
jgi:hypothetical protein